MQRRTLLALLGGGAVGGWGTLALTEEGGGLGGGGLPSVDVDLPDVNDVFSTPDPVNNPWDHTVGHGGVDGYAWADSWQMRLWLNKRHNVDRIVVRHEYDDPDDTRLGYGGIHSGSFPDFGGTIRIHFDSLLGGAYPTPNFVVEATKDEITEYVTLVEFEATLPKGLAAMVVEGVDTPSNVAKLDGMFYAAILEESGVRLKAGLLKNDVDVVVVNPNGERVVASVEEDRMMDQRSTLFAAFDSTPPGTYTVQVYYTTSMMVPPGESKRRLQASYKVDLKHDDG